MKTILLVSLGFVFLVLGAIGLLLPVWPTTPFVLVSAACFSSMPRVKRRLEKLPFFGEHIENYEKRTGLSEKTVRISMIWVWGMLFLSIMVTKSVWITGALVFVGIAVTIHILLMSRAGRGKKGGDE